MNAKILLVEDNAVNRYLETFVLESSGFQVIHAVNGREALALARSECPDLILMDIQMPEMDGYEAARSIREALGGDCMPIVAVTSYAMSGDRERALQLGFAGYLEKPIATEKFAAQIGSFLPKKAGAA